MCYLVILTLPRFSGFRRPCNRILSSIVHLFEMALTADSILHKIFDLSYFSDIFPTIHFTERPEKRRTSDLKCQMFPNLRQKLAKRRGTRKIPFSWLGRHKLSRYCHGVDAQPGILDGQQNIFNSTWGHDRCVSNSIRAVGRSDNSGGT